VLVKTGAGQATATVALGPGSPSFLLRDARHVTAIIVRSDGCGAFDNGEYNLLGASGDCFGYPIHCGRTASHVIELFGVGFWAHEPAVPDRERVFRRSADLPSLLYPL
jgi:hypothetical protein